MKDISSINSTLEQVLEELDFVEVYKVDSEGNQIKTKIY